jgi:hypothetical protein
MIATSIALAVWATVIIAFDFKERTRPLESTEPGTIEKGSTHVTEGLSQS